MTYYNKTIALAGVQLCLTQVQKIAWTGDYSAADINTCLSSLFVRNPDNYAEVFGDIHQIQTGLQALKTSFTDKRDKEALERTRYMINLLLLAKKVQASDTLLQQIGTTLSLLEEAASDMNNQREYVVERLAQLYQNAISSMTPRVIVYGKTEILNQAQNAALIRSLLLAGLRSVILWYQAGGNQINLLLGKNKYVNTIDQMLA